MSRTTRYRALRFFLTFGALAAFIFFYRKYVPLTRPFQLALAPVLSAAFVLAAVKREWGALFFIFSFPLINNLPYLFGIYEDTPHAPTALVLFLAFWLGWTFRGRRPVSGLAWQYPFSRPLILFLGVVSVSGFITFLRFSNFFPFRAREIYEYIVNVNGVRAGGALMSDLFSLLNYLAGPLFFALILPLLAEPEFLRKTLVALSLATGISLAFALLQKYYSLSLGNTPLFIRFNQINGTFKDANSFGAFLSCFVPLALGIALTFKNRLRWLSLILVALSLLVFPAVGSRGSLGALIAALLAFAFLAFSASGRPFKKTLTYAAGSVLAVAALLALLFVFQSQSTLAKRAGAGFGPLSENSSLDQFFNRRLFFWRAAGMMVRAYPLTGVGLGAYVVELPNYLRRLGIMFKRSDSALNYPIHVTAELGLVGLLLIVWTGVEILRQLAASWRSCGPEKKFLLAGVLSGIAAIGVHFIFQTYIGSYEVKCTLWLLIALALSLGGVLESALTAKRSRRNFTRLGLVLILAFGAIHLWNSTRSLSLERRTADLGIRQDFGLDRVEKTSDGREFRWSGKRAGLTVGMNGPNLKVPLLASHPDIRDHPVSVRLYLVRDFFREKKLLGELTLRTPVWQTYNFSLPRENGHDIFLYFTVSRTWNPRQALGVRDPRDLGVAVGKIEF